MVNIYIAFHYGNEVSIIWESFCHILYMYVQPYLLYNTYKNLFFNYNTLKYYIILIKYFCLNRNFGIPISFFWPNFDTKIRNFSKYIWNFGTGIQKIAIVCLKFWYPDIKSLASRSIISEILVPGYHNFGTQHTLSTKIWSLLNRVKSFFKLILE